MPKAELIYLQLFKSYGPKYDFYNFLKYLMCWQDFSLYLISRLFLIFYQDDLHILQALFLVEFIFFFQWYVLCKGDYVQT